MTRVVRDVGMLAAVGIGQEREQSFVDNCVAILQGLAEMSREQDPAVIFVEASPYAPQFADVF